MSDDFAVGSVIRLKSGGLAMTVESVGGDPRGWPGSVVNFVMMTESGLVRGWLPVGLVEAVPVGQPIVRCSDERAVIESVFGPDRPVTGRSGAVDPVAFHADAEKLRHEIEVSKLLDSALAERPGPGSVIMSNSVIMPNDTGVNAWCGDFVRASSGDLVHVLLPNSKRCRCGFAVSTLSTGESTATPS